MGRLVVFVLLLCAATGAQAQHPPMDAGVLDAGPPSDAAREHGASGAPEETTGFVIKTVLGLVAIIGLVWLAAHPRLRRLEELLGVHQVITSGLVFVLLGWIASRPPIDILSGAVLENLTPILHFALGWIGFLIGFQLDIRMINRLPRGTGLTVAIESLAPFLCIAAIGAGFLVLLGEPWRDELALRYAIGLAAAGAISVVALAERVPPWRSRPTPQEVSARVDSLDEIAGVATLAVIGAFFRPLWLEWRWELPGTVWLFLTLGMGSAVGLLAYAMVRERAASAQFLALTLGTVALGAGMAGYVFLSPVVVCFVAGAVLSNLPSDTRGDLWAILTRLERPMYFLLLVVAGALWDPSDWRGWALMVSFIGARVLGSFLGRTMLDRAARAGRSVTRTTDATLRPISPVSIVIVVSLQAMYRGETIGWIVTAVVGGAIVTELLIQVRERFRRKEASP